MCQARVSVPYPSKTWGNAARGQPRDLDFAPHSLSYRHLIILIQPNPYHGAGPAARGQIGDCSQSVAPCSRPSSMRCGMCELCFRRVTNGSHISNACSVSLEIWRHRRLHECGPRDLG